VPAPLGDERDTSTTSTEIRSHLIVSLVAAAWLSFEYLALGPFSWMYGYGAGLETIPVHLALAKSGSELSLWAPFVAGGLDRLSFWGNAQPLSVEALLFSTLPTWFANGLEGFVQRFVAIFFTARVCSEQLGLTRRWSAAGGLIHGCVSYFTAGEMLTFPGVPLVLWLVSHAAKTRRPELWALIAGGLFSLGTTFSQGVPYILVFAVGWFGLVQRESSWRLWRALVTFFAGLALATLPQFLALAFNAPFSHRAGWPIEAVTLSLDGLLYLYPQFDFFAQDKLIGTIVIWLPLVGLTLAIVLGWPNRRQSPFFRLLWRASGLYMLSTLRFAMIGAQAVMAAAWPAILGINAVRFHTVPASFMTAVLVVLSAVVLRERLRPRPFVSRLVAVCLGGIMLFLFVRPKVSLYYPLMVDGWGEENYQVAALQSLKQSDPGTYRVASVLPLQPAYAYAQGFETADGWANLYPAAYRDLWLRVLQPLFVNLPRNRDIFDPPDARPQDNYIFLGTDLFTPGIGLMPGEDPQQALERGFDVDGRFNVRLLGELNVKYLFSEYPLRGSGLRLVHAPDELPRTLQSRDYATGLVNSPRTGYTVDDPGQRLQQLIADTQAALVRKQAGKDVFIYELVDMLPRYRLTTQVTVLDTPSEVLDALSSASSDSLRSTAWLERSDVPPTVSSGSRAGGTVSVICSSPDAIKLHVEALSDAFLVIANTWNPAWVAEVDNQQVPLLRTNHAQLGLVMTAGAFDVRLEYRPPYVALDVWRDFRSRMNCA
jgi:hypothetical protein